MTLVSSVWTDYMYSANLRVVYTRQSYEVEASYALSKTVVALCKCWLEWSEAMHVPQYIWAAVHVPQYDQKQCTYRIYICSMDIKWQDLSMMYLYKCSYGCIDTSLLQMFSHTRITYNCGPFHQIRTNPIFSFLPGLIACTYFCFECILANSNGCPQ